MMFEIGLECSFEKGVDSLVPGLPIKSLDLFSKVNGREQAGTFSGGSFRFLSRRDGESGYAEHDKHAVWIYGSVFTRRAYAKEMGRQAYRMHAAELLQLLLADPTGFSAKIKGSYVLVFWNDSTKQLTIKTDRHNAFPLYYVQRENRLFLSSNVPYLMKISGTPAEIEPEAVAAQLIFDFPLGDKHFIRNVRRFETATQYTFSQAGLSRQRWWSATELHHEQLMDPDESLEALAELLFENVELYTSDAPRFLLSLTGGFDGRTNVAMVRRDTKDFLTYSYGMPGSQQVLIPQEISRKTGIPYEPVMLNNGFLDNYDELRRLTTIYSNGLAPVGFENIPYAFARLSQFADTVITGLFGSEILKPLNPTNGIQLNFRAYDLFFKPDAAASIEAYARRFFEDTPLSKAILSEGLPAALDQFDRSFIQPYREYGAVKSSFFFLLQEGLTKYFQQEIQIERSYVSTRFPYFDSDFIDLVYQTPHAGMYKGFLGKSKVQRRRSQLLYAHIIEKYRPELSRIRLDRMYKPIDLLRPFPVNYLFLGMGVLRKHFYLKRHQGNDTFKPQIWAQQTIENILKVHREERNIDLSFSPSLNFKGTDLEDTFLTYRHLLSVVDFVNYTSR